MAEDVNASIGIDIDASQAIAAIRQLSAEISAFHQLHSKKGAAVAKDLAAQTQNLTHLINRTGSYRASMTSVASATESFTTALEKNKLTMGETMRYAMGSVKPFSKMFKSEWEMVSKVARERVKDLQTQYIRLGRDANGAVQAIKIRPLTLDMENFQTKTMLAAQRMQVFNKLVDHGSTQLLNWGKNTQWAGRQLMVGFTIPLTMLGAASAKTFMDMEKQIIKIQRVYGDFSTTVEETKKMTDSLKELSVEFTKWGVSVDKTLGLAADAAATGAMGADLINQVTNATRLAVLGNVEQAQALETTMSVTNAFGIATQDLAKKIDFLNAVENQSVTSIQDLTTAIPIAAPVIKQLGGNVEDLAFFMTAMKEGGIDAGEGANALKSGLASIINPTEAASEMLKQYGINIKNIVQSNKGDVKGTVVEFAQALDQLDPLNRAQAIEQLFGKFQFSRISTLFQNVIKEGTQAQRVLELSQASTEQLAVLSQRELSKVEESTTYRFEAAMQRFQAALAPVGEEFLKAVTPLLDFGTQLLEQFNNWDQGAKTFAVALTGVVGGIGPVLLMTIGLVANGVANIIKLFQFFAKTMSGAATNTDVLGMQTDYMTQNMLEASAAASSLGQTHSNLTQIYTSEATALRNLATALEQAAVSQRKMQGANVVVGRSTPAKKMAGGGFVSGRGTGTSDSIPAMLSNGEAVIPAKSVAANRGLVEGLIAGSIPGYARGGIAGLIGGMQEKKYKADFALGAGGGYRPNNKFMSAMGERRRIRDLEYAVPLMQEINSLRKNGVPSDEILARIAQDKDKQRLLRRGYADILVADSSGKKTLHGTLGFARYTAANQEKVLAQVQQEILGFKKGPQQKILSGMNAKEQGYYANDLRAHVYGNQRKREMADDDLNFRKQGVEIKDFTKEAKAKLAAQGIDPEKLTPGERALVEQELLRHRSSRKLDLSKLIHPKNVRSQNGRFFGPGLYLAKDPEVSHKQFGGFGKNAYSLNLSEEAKERTRQSKGYIDEQTMAAKLEEHSDLLINRGFRKSNVPGRTSAGLFNAKWQDPFIQQLLKEGYIGYKHGSAYTNWLVGTPGWGLKKEKFANGGFVSGKGTGTSDSIPAMLSNGEAVIPADMTKKYAPLVEGLISGNIPGYVDGTAGVGTRKGSLGGLPFDFAHIGSGIFMQVSELLQSNLKLGTTLTDRLASLSKVDPAAPVALKHSWGRKMEDQTNVELGNPSGAKISNVARQFDGNVAEGYASSAKLSGFDINDLGLQEELKNYDMVMRRKLEELEAAGITAMVDTEEQLQRLPEEQRKFIRSVEQLDKETINELAAENKKLVELRSTARKTVRDVRIGEGLTEAQKLAVRNDPEALDKLKKRRGSQQIWVSRQRKSAGGFGVLDTEIESSAFSAGQQVVESSQKAFNNGLAEAAQTASPSKKTKEVAKDTVDGYVVGLEAGKEKVAKSGQAMSSVKRNTNPAFGMVAAGAAPQLSSGFQTFFSNIAKKAIPGSPVSPTRAREAASVDMFQQRVNMMVASIDKARMPITMLEDAANVAKSGLITAAQATKDFSIKAALAAKDFAVKGADAAKRLAIAAKDAAVSVANSAKQMAINAGASIASGARNLGTKAKNFVTSGRGAMIGSTASMGLMMASGMEGPMGDIAGAISGPLFALSSFGQVLGGLPPQVTAVIVALGALAAVGIGLKQTFDDAVKKAIEFTDTMGAGTKSMQKLAEFTGKVSDAQAKDKERQDTISKAKTQGVKDPTIGDSFLQTDAGTAMTAAITNNIKNVDMGVIREQLYQQMATAIATGAIDTQTAKSIVMALGEKLQDPSMAINVNAKIDNVFGPNGKNLENSKLEILAEVSKSSMDETMKTIDQMQARTSDIGQMVQNDWYDPLTLGVSQLFDYWGKFGEITGLTTGLATQTIQQQQDLLDSLDIEYEKRIRNAKTSGADTTQITKDFEQSRQEIIDAQNKTRESATASYTAELERMRGSGYSDAGGLNTTIQLGALGNAMDAQIAKTFEGDAVQSQLAEQAKNLIVNSEGSGLDAQNREQQVKFLLSTGEIPPQTFIDLMTGLTGEAATKQNEMMLNIVSNLGTAEGGQILQMAALIQNPETRKEFQILFEGDAEQAQKYSDLFAKVSEFGGANAVEVISSRSTEEMNELIGKYNEIYEATSRGPITMETVVNLDPAFSALQSQTEYFNSLPASQQKVFLERYLTVFETVTPGQAAQALRAAGVQPGQYEGSMMTYTDSQLEQGAGMFAAGQAKNFIEAFNASGGAGEDPGSGSGSGGGGGGAGKTAEEQLLEDLNFALGKQQKALSIIAMQEEEINKKYEDRKKALAEIAAINAQIAEEQRSQLDLADSLASGDIAAAARAAQTMRAQAAENAMKDQEKSLEDARKAELARVSFDGLSRDQLENSMKALELQIAELEYRMPKREDTGGGGGGGGGYGGGLDTTATDATPTDTTPSGPLVPVGTTPTPNTGSMLTSAPVAPSASANWGANPNFDAQMAAFNEANNKWIAQTYSAIDALGISGSSFQTLGNDTDALRAKIEAMGYSVKEDGTVTINGITTSLDAMSTQLKLIGPNVTKAAEDAANAVLSTGGTADAAERAANAARDAASGAAGAADGAASEATRARASAQVATGAMTLRAYEAAFGARAMGGLITGPGTGTSDSIPTMLSNGEYVVRAASVAKIGIPALNAINAGNIPELRGANVSANSISINSGRTSINRNSASSDSGSVYNYSVVVNAETNANPDQIAGAVMAKIKQVESQRVRGVVR